MNLWLSAAGGLAGIAALLQFGWGAIQSWRGGSVRRQQAEAVKATLDVEQAEQSLPHVAESLRLGNVGEAVTIQQQIINGLREHAAWQDEQLQRRDARIQELEERLEQRDNRIDELEKRLELAEEALTTARTIINDLRRTRSDEQHAQTVQIPEQITATTPEENNEDGD